MLGQFWQTRDRVDQVIAETNWMGRRKSKPFDAIDFIHCFEQLHKGTLAVLFRKFVTPIEIHDLSK